MVTLQTLAKHYNMRKEYQKAFVVAFISYHKNLELTKNDKIFVKVNKFIMAKMSNEGRRKQE